MTKIHDQLKQRRKSLGLTQEDMTMRVGMQRQQYQRLESQGNPRLDTLELVAKGLKMEVMLIPEEKRQEVEAILAGSTLAFDHSIATDEATTPSTDPWQGLLGEPDE